MKIPKQLKIGGHVYKVVLKKGPISDSDEQGYVDDEKGEIVLRSNVPKSHLETSLIHEILHCLNSVMNHELIDSLSEQIYQVFKDNKLL